MCLICDGLTLDEMLDRFSATIQSDGFVLQGVGDPAGDRPGWVYTIGLIEHANHPELIVAGAQLDRSAELLHQFATGVLEHGEWLAVGETIDLGSEDAYVGAVHPIQYRFNTFATWHNLVERGDLCNYPLEAVQVFTPTSWVVSRRPQPVLAHPWVHVDGKQSPIRSRPRAG